VIVGTPGVGKSSVSSLLASRFDGKHIDLGNLIKHEGLNLGLDKARETLIADEERIRKRIRETIRQSEGYVIVDSHFAMDVVAAGDVFLAFVLRRDPDELREILKKRKFREAKVTENVVAEILDVCLYDIVKAYGVMKICEVDVSHRTVEDVVDEMTCIIDGRKQCHVGVVDWLTKLESEGRLDEFFASF